MFSLPEQSSLAPTLVSELVSRAVSARHQAYAPYSNFQVGAALLDATYQTWVGCNVENASYGATICAERVAACSAIAAGQRQWLAIAIATSTGGAPCGICRQFLAEFAPDLEVFTIATQHGQINRYLVRELLPHAFKL